MGSEKCIRALQMEEYIKEVKKAGDSVGGVITGVAKNVPVGFPLIPFYGGEQRG